MTELLTFGAYRNVNDERTFVTLVGETIAPGLAIAPAIRDGGFQGGWLLVHLASGMPLTPMAICLRCLRAAATKVTAAAAVDWTWHEDVLKVDPAARAVIEHLLEGWSLCRGAHCAHLAPTDDDLELGQALGAEVSGR
uniref:hypothetical protein n=1 Tax=Actinoplanes sp. CA-084688 TaxID=3239901 RepID=UPI003F499400